MKVILIAAMSLNGKLTNGDLPPHEWASVEDQVFFQQMITQHNLIVMGRKTYQQAQKIIKLEMGKQRVVMTRTPKQFATETVNGQLEFTNESPQKLVQRFRQNGYKEMLLVGGGQMNGDFLTANLVNEMWLTIEPVIFATGVELTQKENGAGKFTLQSVQQLNPNGTLLVKYQRVN